MPLYADSLDNGLSKCGLDAVLQRAFDNGLDLDEIMYVVQTHTEKTVQLLLLQFCLAPITMARNGTVTYYLYVNIYIVSNCLVVYIAENMAETKNPTVSSESWGTPLTPSKYISVYK